MREILEEKRVNSHQNISTGLTKEGRSWYLFGFGPHVDFRTLRMLSDLFIFKA